MKKLLIASAEQGDILTASQCFAGEYEIRRARDKTAFLERLGQDHPDLAFIDIRVLTADAEKTTDQLYARELARFREKSPATQIFVLCPAALTREAVKAVKAGASNYLASPLDPAEINYVTESLEEMERLQLELNYLRDSFWKEDSAAIVKTNSPVMREVFHNIRRVAPTNTTVLLTGETGVGKGTLARLIHLHSTRAHRPFISVNCGAIPENLVESELFGHEKGAFTGAVRKKLGKFEIAAGGAIFLDEVGALPPATQVKLLGVLQDRSFQRVGGEEDIEVDVRIIAATNDNLKDACKNGRFRTDLFYRLNVFPIDIPPLRERVEDIRLIAETILRRLQKIEPHFIQSIDPTVFRAFELYHWPGNVRELENLLERAYILEDSAALTPRSFPAELFPRLAPLSLAPPDTSLPLIEVKKTRAEQIEKEYLSEQLKRHKGRINETAAASGIGVRYLHKLLARHGLRKEEYKGQG